MSYPLPTNDPAKCKSVFVSGGTGYVGQVLVECLLQRGHQAVVLTRNGSQHKVPIGAKPVLGDALDAASVRACLVESGASVLVHLTGTPHPAPWKEAQFRAIDLVSLKASVAAAQSADISHFLYVSVAQPAPVMLAYVEVRSECEEILYAAGLTQTILRPWYVLGPGHRWPVMLKPVYAALSAIPATRDGAQRLGLVTLEEMVAALVLSIENPPESRQILDVPAIRDAARQC